MWKSKRLALKMSMETEANKIRKRKATLVLKCLVLSESRWPCYILKNASFVLLLLFFRNTTHCMGKSCRQLLWAGQGKNRKRIREERQKTGSGIVWTWRLSRPTCSTTTRILQPTCNVTTKDPILQSRLLTLQEFTF